VPVLCDMQLVVLAGGKVPPELAKGLVHRDWIGLVDIKTGLACFCKSFAVVIRHPGVHVHLGDENFRLVGSRATSAGKCVVEIVLLGVILQWLWGEADWQSRTSGSRSRLVVPHLVDTGQHRIVAISCRLPVEV